MKQETLMRLEAWSKKYSETKIDRYTFMKTFYRLGTQIILPTLKEIENCLKAKGHKCSVTQFVEEYAYPYGNRLGVTIEISPSAIPFSGYNGNLSPCYISFEASVATGCVFVDCQGNKFMGEKFIEQKQFRIEQITPSVVEEVVCKCLELALS